MITPLPCIVFEDEYVLVINKPAGLNTHSPAPFAGEGIYDWLRHREPRWSSLAIIHRLDKDTSGLIVFGKSKKANVSLTDQFSSRVVRKRYLLITDRPVDSLKSTVRSAIVRVGNKYLSRPVHQGATIAETHFRIIAPSKNGTLVLATPVTGRTHQIRVHAATQGIPILGDTLYGGTSAKRLYLHAESLSFRHPVTSEESNFQVKAPFESDSCMLIRSGLIDSDLTTAYRLLHGSSDQWHGWYLDRIGDYLLSQSSEKNPTPPQRERISHLTRSLSLQGVYHKTLNRQIQNRSSADASPKLIEGKPAVNPFRICENGLRFEVSFQEGYSMGLFLDQRDNRRRILSNYIAAGFPLFAQIADSPEVLNVFAYTCAFSVCAAKIGTRVTSLDLSKKYLEWGKRNFLENGLNPNDHDFIFGDAFDWLRRLEKKGRRFDFIILDPPTFSRSKKIGTFQVQSNYPDLLRLAMPLLKPAGVLLASSNASGWKPSVFSDTLLQTIQENGRSILKQHFAPQPPDFPITRTEPSYLKTLWLKIASCT